MNKIVEKKEYTPYESEIFNAYFRGFKIGFFDIETTGLSPQKNKVILAGLAVVEDGFLKIIQFFAEDPSQEPVLLKELLNELDKLDMVITYNGRAFDIPFLKTRLEKNRIWLNRNLPYNLDLMRAVKNHSPLKKMLPNLKQKTLEAFMGLWHTREDMISGKESVDLYYIYAGEKDEKVKKAILLHNRDDIVQLSKLLPVLEKCNLHSFILREGFPYENLVVDKIEIRKKSFTLEGYQRFSFIDGQCFDNIEAVFKEEKRSFKIRIPLIYTNELVLADLESLNLSSENAIEDYLLLVKEKDIYFEHANELAMKIVKKTLETIKK